MIFSYSGFSLELPNPRYGYMSTIDLSLDISSGSNGSKSYYDNGAHYDIYKCECSFKLDRDKYNEAMQFFAVDAISQSVTIALSSGSGFFPFSPFRGDSGNHTIKIISFFGDRIDNGFRTRNLNISFQKVGSLFPSFTGNSDNNGCVQIGSVTGINQMRVFSEIHDERSLSSESRSVYQSYNHGYSTKFPIDILDRGNKTGEIVEEILSKRDSEILLEYPSYKFGESVGILTKLNDNRLTIVHEDYDKFTTKMSLIYADRVYS